MPENEYVNKALDRMENYMEEGRGFRETVVGHMATINTKMDTFIDYQERCDAERKDHADRIAACERFKNENTAVAKSWIWGIPLLSGVISWTVKHFG